MKFKTLFLSMLAAAAIVSCNNESVLSGDELNGGAGEDTYATFYLKAGVSSATTYAGDEYKTGTGRENAVGDAVLAIYNAISGSAEALAYVAEVPENTDNNSGSGGKVTLKCKTGSKVIYLAVNVGVGTGAAASTSPSTASNLLVYGNTSATASNVDNVTPSPGSWTGSENFDGANGTLFADTLNALIVALADATYVNDFRNTAFSGVTLPTPGVKADGLIKGLTGKGNSNNGVLSGDGNSVLTAYYLMSNWKGNDDIAGGGGAGKTNKSTATFDLKKVTAEASRRVTGSEKPDSNAFIINVQRAVAKIALNITSTAAAGSGTNAGTLDFASVDGTPAQTKFVVGNLSKAVYPFQQFDGSIVKSPAYNCTDGITSGTNNQFRRFMDNSRIYGAYDFSTYPAGKGTVVSILSNINNANNTAYTVGGSPTFSVPANYTIVTENNQVSATNAYSTYVVFSAVYKPTSIIISAPPGSADTDDGTNATVGRASSVTYSGGATDTLYYVKDPNYSLLAGGKFFHGANTLGNYIKNVLGVTDQADYDALLADWNKVNGAVYSKLQKYWKGVCFYRIWVKDEATSTTPADKFLVRRNHAYNINVTGFEGPGIGDPYSIIDPDPSTGPEELDESDTFVTATINVLPWHTVSQNTTVGME
jgi:hypothetical protein